MRYYCDWFHNKYILFNVRSKSLHGTDGMRMSRTKTKIHHSLYEGDKVICSYLEPTLWETSVKKNYVYVIVTHGDVLVKRVHNKIKVDKSLTLFLTRGGGVYGLPLTYTL